MNDLVPVLIDRGFRKAPGGLESRNGRLIRGMASMANPPAMMCFKYNANPYIQAVGYWYLHDDIGEWLMDRGVISLHCDLFYDDSEEEWYLYVPKRIALLFKLTWGGV